MQTIAIIGSGPTALYTVRHLLFEQTAPLSITMFESQRIAGKGMPYHPDWTDKALLSNIASIEIPPLMETLLDWLSRQSDASLEAMGVNRDAIDPRAFFPRVVLGDYFRSQLIQLVDKAASVGSSLTIKSSHRVIDVKIGSQAIQLAVKQDDGGMHYPAFDQVVMATGHAWPEETQLKPGYFLSPWPARTLHSIDHCYVGILGTSLSGIDAVVTLAVARGAFLRDTAGLLHYHPEPGTDGFHTTLMSRKGLLPEADFYHPVPYLPLQVCIQAAIDGSIAMQHPALLDIAYDLFKAELTAADPDYAARINLHELPLENFCHAYFHEREAQDPFIWAEKNLAEAKLHQTQHHTVAWRYAILRMHEVIARIAPHLNAEDHVRFNRYFKPVFVDDYATVPHDSIERLLALRRAGKLDILRLGEDYKLNAANPSGATVRIGEKLFHFPAFIEATGQRILPANKFPFPSLCSQGVIRNATAPHRIQAQQSGATESVDIGGVALDAQFHPVCNKPMASRLYCLSLPFMLNRFPFAQGITSSDEMGRIVAQDILATIEKIEAQTTSKHYPLSYLDKFSPSEFNGN